jgi:hypothetical protein
VLSEEKKTKRRKIKKRRLEKKQKNKKQKNKREKMSGKVLDYTITGNTNATRFLQAQPCVQYFHTPQ